MGGLLSAGVGSRGGGMIGRLLVRFSSLRLVADG